MSPGMAARTAIVCTVIAWGAIAHAERRRVAVIDISGDPTSEDLARLVGNELTAHPELQIIFDQTILGDLMGPYDDENASGVAQALTAKRQIDDQLGNQSNPANVIPLATQAHDALHRVVPTPAALALYADLSFAIGWARLGEKKLVEAAAAFEVTFRLAPDRVVDPNNTPPDVAAAFEAARVSTKNRGQATLMVKGSGHVWIDGKEMGPPGPYDVPAGTHVVWLTGPERETRGTQISVAASKVAVAEIPDATAPFRLKVRRARIALRNATDSAGRASAMKQLAKLLGVHDAVLLTTANGKVIVQTWRDQAPGFSALREVKTEKPKELLYALAPPPKVYVPPPPPPYVTPPKPWYRKRSYQIGLTSVIALVATLVIANSFEGHVPLDNNPTTR